MLPQWAFYVQSFLFIPFLVVAVLGWSLEPFIRHIVLDEHKKRFRTYVTDPIGRAMRAGTLQEAEELLRRALVWYSSSTYFPLDVRRNSAPRRAIPWDLLGRREQIITWYNQLCAIQQNMRRTLRETAGKGDRAHELLRYRAQIEAAEEPADADLWPYNVASLYTMGLMVWISSILLLLINQLAWPALFALIEMIQSGR